MSRPTNSFTSLAGVPVHYARNPVAPYGTRGRPHTFYVTGEVERKLEACFSELWEVCPHGQAEVITSAGTYVNRSGYHGLGRALDLDAIFWSDKDFITLSFPTDQRFYLGVEAIIRKHFGTVLNHLYNNAHRDHLHLDDSTEVGFVRSSRARVLFLQAALTYVFNISVIIDGVYGPQTSGAITRTLSIIGVSGSIEDRAVWLAFLSHVAETAFSSEDSASNVDDSPLTLLRKVHEVIDHELKDDSSRKTVESALNVFSDHEATREWLERFE
jgi:hypothetical protein